MKKVTIYSTPTCHFCHMAKEFFTKNNIEFTDHDVSVDAEKRAEMVDVTGQMGVPVISVGDTSNESGMEEVIVGFDENKLKSLLEI